MATLTSVKLHIGHYKASQQITNVNQLKGDNNGNESKNSMRNNFRITVVRILY